MLKGKYRLTFPLNSKSGYRYSRLHKIDVPSPGPFVCQSLKNKYNANLMLQKSSATLINSIEDQN